MSKEEKKEVVKISPADIANIKAEKSAVVNSNQTVQK